MRTAAALLAALLAACAGEVDGAPCTVAGTTADCPGGQACGNDLRCSARALACVASRCTPGEGDACLDPAGLGSGSALARWCDGSDPVCGAWVLDRCAARGYVCGGRSGAARCECPPATTSSFELSVAADGASPDVLPFGTGASAPRGCGFATITEALVRAGQLRQVDPSAVVTVSVTGAPPGGVRSFSSATGERFPLRLDRRVVLRSDAGAGGGTYEIVAQDSTMPDVSAFALLEGTRVHGFTVRKGGTGAAGFAFAAACPVNGVPPRISAVTIDGRGPDGARLAGGIRTVLSCPIELEEVHVRNAEVGVAWDPEPGSGALLSLRGGSITASGSDGLRATAGAVLLDGVRVAENGRRGIDVAGAALELRSSNVVRNGDTGVAVSSPGALRLVRNTIWGNAATTEWGGSAVPSGITRRAGGVVLSGIPPADLELWGNRIYGNRGDQLLVHGSALAIWTLDRPATPTCSDALGPVTNVFGCYDPTPAGTTGPSRGIVAIDAGASARNQWWSGGTPSSPADAARLPSGTVDVTTACPSPAPALDCASEAPP